MSNINNINRASDIADFFAFLENQGFNYEEFERISSNSEDVCDFPSPTQVRIGESLIQGVGVIAEKDFEQGEVVAPARVGSKRTPAGRYTNHSQFPNAEMFMRENGDVDLVASCGLQAGEEVTVDYRQVIKLFKLSFFNEERALCFVNQARRLQKKLGLEGGITLSDVIAAPGVIRN